MPHSKDEILEQILQFSNSVDDAVSEGSLTGTSSPPPVARNRLNAFRNMIAIAQNLFRNREIGNCHEQYLSALGKCDGQELPPDFVTGSAREIIALQISSLLTALAAEMERDCAYGTLKAQRKV